jgi:hypothetical protein
MDNGSVLPAWDGIGRVAVRCVIALVAGVVGLMRAGGASGLSPVPSACHPTSHLICVDRAAGGAVVHAVIGQKVEVAFINSGLQWRIARMPDLHVLRSAAPPIRRGGSFVAIFDTVGVGRTVITLAGTPICAPRTPCPQFIVLWHATVAATARR